MSRSFSTTVTVEFTIGVSIEVDASRHFSGDGFNEPYAVEDDYSQAKMTACEVDLKGFPKPPEELRKAILDWALKEEWFADQVSLQLEDYEEDVPERDKYDD